MRIADKAAKKARRQAKRMTPMPKSVVASLRIARRKTYKNKAKNQMLRRKNPNVRQIKNGEVTKTY
jgi:hypothetical protein